MPEKKPLRRHPNLQPLSRDHHRGLVLAQLLKYDVPDYPGLPATVAGKAAYAIEFFDTQLQAHFEREENILLPAITGYDALLDRYGEQMCEEHRRIRNMLESWRQNPPNGADLDQMGRCLEEHIRFEERVFFQHLQATAPAAVLEQLELEKA